MNITKSDPKPKKSRIITCFAFQHKFSRISWGPTQKYRPLPSNTLQFPLLSCRAVPHRWTPSSSLIPQGQEGPFHNCCAWFERWHHAQTRRPLPAPQRWEAGMGGKDKEYFNGCMDGWMDKWTNKQTNERMWMNAWIWKTEFWFPNDLRGRFLVGFITYIHTYVHI